MVQFILTEEQLNCLQAAVAAGSEEYVALSKGRRFGAKVLRPEPIAVDCDLPIATRLPAIAEVLCPDIVEEIRAAIERA